MKKNKIGFSKMHDKEAIATTTPLLSSLYTKKDGVIEGRYRETISKVNFCYYLLILYIVTPSFLYIYIYFPLSLVIIIIY